MSSSCFVVVQQRLILSADGGGSVGAGDYIDFLHQLSRKVTAEEDNKPVPFTPQVQKLIRCGPNPGDDPEHGTREPFRECWLELASTSSAFYRSEE